MISLCSKIKFNFYNSYIVASEISKRWRYSKVDTVDLAYNLYDEIDADGSNEIRSKAPVFVSHALLGSKSNWDYLSKGLNKATGRKVFNIDARNHGDSGHSPQHSYVHMAHDMKKLMEKLGIPKAVVIGHSMAGRTFLTMSLLFPNLVSSIISIEVSSVFTSPMMFKIPKMFEVMSTLSIPNGTGPPEALRLTDQHLKLFTPDVNIRNYLASNLIQTDSGDYVWKMNLNALENSFNTEMIGFPDLKGHKFMGPALFVGGTCSDHLRFCDLEKIKEQFPLAEMVFIEGAHHFIHAQMPDKLIEVISSFLRTKE